jgi:hypothetical protein
MVVGPNGPEWTVGPGGPGKGGGGAREEDGTAAGSDDLREEEEITGCFGAGRPR